jgi:hypothetical protein
MNILRHRRAGIAGDVVPGAMRFDDLRSGVRGGDELDGVALRGSTIERIGRGRDADQINMMRPMPFWPSFEPWKNDTSVQVRINNPRIQGDGGLLVVGAV